MPRNVRKAIGFIVCFNDGRGTITPTRVGVEKVEKFRERVTAEPVLLRADGEVTLFQNRGSAGAWITRTKRALPIPAHIRYFTVKLVAPPAEAA